MIVLEASSFQLEDTLEFAPDAAVLLNLAPDHLDRHGSFEAYRDAKLRIFAAQSPEAIAVVPAGFEPPGRAGRVTFASPMTAGARDGGDADLTLDAGRLVWRGEPLMDAAAIRLRGTHNLENAMAAAAVTLARGIDPAAVRAALAGFAGVAHRLEEVARVGDVLYVDDSKATNVASAVVGIRSFAGGVHVILGGRGKREDYAPLAAAVAERCRAAYLIGEEEERLAAALAATGVPAHRCGDLGRAVAAARAAAVPGDVVLLSPACASYDQFRSFDERGDAFKALATARVTIRRRERPARGARHGRGQPAGAGRPDPSGMSAGERHVGVGEPPRRRAPSARGRGPGCRRRRPRRRRSCPRAASSRAARRR